jgi:cytochrome c556
MNSASWPGFGKEGQRNGQGRRSRRPAAIKAQFGKLGEACKACHDKFRKEE